MDETTPALAAPISPDTPSAETGTAQIKASGFSLLELSIFAILVIYLIHVLMGWTYGLFWWPLQS